MSLRIHFLTEVLTTTQKKPFSEHLKSKPKAPTFWTSAENRLDHPANRTARASGISALKKNCREFCPSLTPCTENCGSRYRLILTNQKPRARQFRLAQKSSMMSAG